MGNLFARGVGGVIVSCAMVVFVVMTSNKRRFTDGNISISF